MAKFKIRGLLDKAKRGEALTFDMTSILKEIKKEIFNPTGKKKQVYVSSTPGGGDSRPLFSTGKFKRSIFVSGRDSIKSNDPKFPTLKERLGSNYFKPTFSQIMKYTKINNK